MNTQLKSEIDWLLELRKDISDEAITLLDFFRAMEPLEVRFVPLREFPSSEEQMRKEADKFVQAFDEFSSILIRFVGEVYFADGDLQQLKDRFDRVSATLYPVRMRTETNLFRSECATETLLMTRMTLMAQLHRTGILKERFLYYQSLSNTLEDRLGRRPTPSDWDWEFDRLFSSEKHDDDWHREDWVCLDSAIRGLSEFMTGRPKDHIAFIEALRNNAVAESMRAMEYVRNLSGGGIPLAPPTPEHARADDAPVNRPPKLDADDWKLLEAAFALGATSMESRTKHIKIANHLDPHVINSDHLKRPMSALVKAGFFHSKGHRGGGVWLTKQGLETVRER